jgi:cytochrome P450
MRETQDLAPAYDFLTRKHADPWPIVARDRARCPVQHDPGVGVYRVTGWEALDTVLRDWRTYSSRGTVNSHQEEILAFADPPRHDRQRRLFTAALSRRGVERLGPSIQSLADRLVDEIVESGRSSFDVVEEFANPLVLGMIVELLGVPASDVTRFREWTKAAERNSYRPNADDMAALRAFREYSMALVAARRKTEDRPHDFVTALVEADWDGERLSDREICNLMEFLLVAANSTTTDAIGNLVWALETHPDEKRLLLDDLEGRVDGAIEEILRFDGPIHALQRTVTGETELSGVAIPAGAVMLNLYGAASHDPAAYDDADGFHIDRDWSTLPHHFGFGWGLHFCLGAHLARREIRAAIVALYSRLPGLRAVDGFEPVQVPAPFLRGWQEVLVTFDSEP